MALASTAAPEERTYEGVARRDGVGSPTSNSTATIKRLGTYENAGAAGRAYDARREERLPEPGTSRSRARRLRARCRGAGTGRRPGTVSTIAAGRPRTTRRRRRSSR